MLSSALDQHAETLEDLDGEQFAYERSSSSCNVTGIYARRRNDEEQQGRSRALVSAKLVDILVRPKWLLDSGFGQPKPGDRLTSSDGRRFEVHSQSEEPCFIWSDPRHTFFRIHTIELKQV